MPRPARPFVSILAAFALAAVGRAQASAESADPTSAIAAPTPPPASPKHERAISSNLASTLAASMPKYNPPPKPKPEDEDIDLRETDKPKNGIVRLPKYTVQEKKPPVFRERDIFNRAGFADLAKRRYLTPTYRALNSFYIPLFTASPAEHALAMYAEDERLNNMAELTDNAKDVGRANPADGASLKRATDQTYMRTDDFRFEPQDLKRR